MRLPGFGWRTRACVGVVLGALAVAACSLRPDQRQQWLEDYDQLREHTAAVYANLEWMIEARGLDPHELHTRTLRDLETARTPGQAGAALHRFVATFDDPHFRLEEPYGWFRTWLRRMLRGESGGPLFAEMSADEALGALGVRADDLDFEQDFEDLPGFTALATSPQNPFPVARVERPGGGSFGLLRIASFGTDRFPECAAEVWNQFRETRTGELSEADRFAFFVALCDQILRHLEESLARLQEAPLDALLIDITGNGGGTDWVDPAARMLSARPLRSPAAGMLKLPDELAGLEQRQEELRRELARTDLPPSDHALLGEAWSRLDALLEAVRQPCDRSGIWETAGTEPRCSLVVEAPHFTSGLFAHLPAAALPDVHCRTELFHPLIFAYRDGLYDGPLFVLVDGGTASASEHFAAMLQDNGAAKILGEKTIGASCGYVNGGNPLTLTHCGWTVRLPNCTRLRADGSNEVEGITPDIPLDLKQDNAAEEAIRCMEEQLKSYRDR